MKKNGLRLHSVCQEEKCVVQKIKDASLHTNKKNKDKRQEAELLYSC